MSDGPVFVYWTKRSQVQKGAKAGEDAAADEGASKKGEEK